MQHCRRMIMASSQANIARHLARSLPPSQTNIAGAVVSNVHCLSTHAASAMGGVSNSQEPPTSRQDWELPPLARIQNAVDRFRQEQFIDELPSRTQKSIAEAAAAGKGYVTPEDIIRVMANIAGRNVLTAGEAETICKTWGEKPPVEAMTTPSISVATFLRLIGASPK